MTPASLFAPIAAATVLNVFLFAGAWRADQIERATGKDHLLSTLGLIAYCVALAGFVYLKHNDGVSGGFDIFMSALAAEAGGAVVVYALLHGFFFSRGQSKGQRTFAISLALTLTAGMIAGLFVS